MPGAMILESGCLSGCVLAVPVQVDLSTEAKVAPAKSLSPGLVAGKSKLQYFWGSN